MAVHKLEAQNDRADWLAWRRQGLGGSDAPAIAGISPFATPVSVWLSKMFEIDSAPTEAMRWGNLLERIVIEEFEERTGLQVISTQERCESPTWPVMRATIDGVVFDPVAYTALDELTGIADGALFEGKTSGDWARREWEESVPEHVQVQVQHQMAVTGHNACWVVALLGGQKLVSHLVERDQAAIDLLMEIEHDFWHKHVLTGIQPPADGSAATTDAIKEAFDAASADVVELPANAAELIAEVSEADAAKKEAEGRGDAARNALRLMLGPAAIGAINGQPVATWKDVSSSHLDVEALRFNHPDIAAKFTKASTSRRLLFPKSKGEKS